MVYKLMDMVMYGWDGAAALFGILTVALAVAFAVCVIRIIVLFIKLAVSYIQDVITYREIKELSKGKDVE